MNVKPQATVQPEPMPSSIGTKLFSVHIHLDESGDIVRVENRKDKDKTVYIYDDTGRCIMKLGEGSDIDLRGSK